MCPALLLNILTYLSYYCLHLVVLQTCSKKQHSGQINVQHGNRSSFYRCWTLFYRYGGVPKLGPHPDFYHPFRTMDFPMEINHPASERAWGIPHWRNPPYVQPFLGKAWCWIILHLSCVNSLRSGPKGVAIDILIEFGWNHNYRSNHPLKHGYR